MENLQTILARMDTDNIWNNSEEDIIALQKVLGVKADGIFGTNTIKALQRQLRIKDDGKWGNQSRTAAKGFKGLPPVPQGGSTPTSQETDGWGPRNVGTQVAGTQPVEGDPNFNFWDGSWAFGQQLWDVNRGNNVPDDYMPQTRGGRATPETIAEERLGTVSGYITDDIGSDVTYNLGTHVPRQERREVVHEGNDDALIEEFNNAYTAATGDASRQINYPIYPRGWGATGYMIEANTNPYSWTNWMDQYLNQEPFDLSAPEEGESWASYRMSNIPFYQPPTNYELELGKHLATIPAETRVTTITKSAGTGPQSQLSATDRRQWTADLNTEVLQIAELYSQLEDAKTRMANGYTPEQRAQAKSEYEALAHQIAMMSNADTFSLNGQRISAFPQDYQAAIDAGLESWTPENREVLQDMYSKYRMSPYWNHMPWGERYTLDHLYGAGYSYNDVSSGAQQTAGQIGQKLSDAISGTFTPRTLNGADNGWFTLSGDRQGVHRHLTQRGDNITNWQFNTAPTDAQGVRMDQPYFQIGAQQAWDWKEGVPRIPLSTTMNFKYGSHQRNIPVMGDVNIMNNPYMDRDFSNFGDWSVSDQQGVANWLSNNGFNVTDTSLRGYSNMAANGGTQAYDPEAVKKTMIAIQNAKKALSNPSAGQLSGQNSFYHLPMQQTNKYTSNIFGNSISGIQMMDGKPYSFNQDNYDISAGWYDMFGNSTWYRNINEIPQSQWQAIRGMAGN